MKLIVRLVVAIVFTLAVVLFALLTLVTGAGKKGGPL